MLNTILRGHYKIISHLGGGGFGQTYLAEDIDLPTHPTCVVKQLKPVSNEPFVLETAKRLFDQEAEMLYSLGSHDRIPRLLAHFQEGEEFYLVQEFADGTDLTQEISSGKRSPESVVIALLNEVLEILVYVHDRNVVHRDIKPANLIRRNSDRKIVLIDFGAVKEIGSLAVDPQGNTNLTIAIGSPGYMPIEQLNGKPRFSSDIYAVGMMAIQAVTGAEPRLFDEHPDTAELVWRDRIQGTYSSQFLDILDKMVRYDFRQRYQTASEVLEAIESLPKVTEHDLPTVISNSNHLSNNTETLITSPQVATKLSETQNHPSSSHTVPLAATNRQSPKLWIWITGGVALLLLIVMAIISKTAKNAPEVPNSPVVINSATPPAISPPTPPKATPSPTASPTPLSVEELLAQALILNRNNKPQEALAKVEEAIKLEPNSADAWGAKGLLLRSMGREKEAIAAFSKAIELSPNERPILPIQRELPSKKGDKKK
ncbi:serine/threonine-protein kinase [Pseudanabaena sp. BC1403]|uniref:serine/threonine-protein kinase n=1 Tax=Pseudanabaena sp. BC1403 TaxID=2043171 RepID=UPI000CD8E1A4|nr:serine/threonine-protein kinase [Pseudanabaena sp. BC1403]